MSSRGRRDIAAADLFTGLWETSLAADEILTAVRFPVWSGRCGFAVEELARRHGDFAIAGATVALELDGDNEVTRCGIGLLGLGSTPLRGVDGEQAVGRLALAALTDVPADLQGSASYRRRVGAAMVSRALASAVAQVTSEEMIHA